MALLVLVAHRLTVPDAPLFLTLWSTLMTAQGGGMSFLSAVDYLLPKWAHLLDVWTMPPLLRDCCYSRSFVRLE